MRFPLVGILLVTLALLPLALVVMITLFLIGG